LSTGTKEIGTNVLEDYSASISSPYPENEGRRFHRNDGKDLPD
jgi:hypothetical protein